MAGHTRLRQIAAVWRDGRCVIARGYENDRDLWREIDRLKQRHRVRGKLRQEAGTLEDVARAWSGTAETGRVLAADNLKARLSAIFGEAATARASMSSSRTTAPSAVSGSSSTMPGCRSAIRCVPTRVGN